MGDTMRVLNHRSNVIEAGGHRFARERQVRAARLLEFLGESALRESVFWYAIYRDSIEALNYLSDRGRDESIRRAFSKSSSVSRRLWKGPGIEPLYGR
jgi:hypothetical protein